MEILKGFLTAVLGIPIEGFERMEYKDTQLLRRHEDDKLAILDVLVRLVDGRHVHIEIQFYFHKFLLERITFYNAKLISEQLEKGQDYDQLRKVVSLLISYETTIKGSDKYHHRFRLYDDEHGVLLTDLVEIHTLELSKLPVQPDQDELKYHWLKFLKSDTAEELKMAATHDELIQKAYEELEKLGQNKENMREYDRKLLAILDEKARIQTAREEGAWQRAVDGAKNMLAMGLGSLEQIADILKLPLAAVQDLANGEEVKDESDYLGKRN